MLQHDQIAFSPELLVTFVLFACSSFSFVLYSYAHLLTDVNTDITLNNHLRQTCVLPVASGLPVDSEFGQSANFETFALSRPESCSEDRKSHAARYS